MKAGIIIALLVMVLLLINAIYLRLRLRFELVLNQQAKSVKIDVLPVWKRFEWHKHMELPIGWAQIINDLIEKRKHKALHPTSKKRNTPINPFKDIHAVLNLGRLFFKYMAVEKLDWRTRLGLDDIMYTAVACGGIWTAKGTITGMIGSFSRLHDLNLEVEPDYLHKEISSSLFCILKMRIVYIMFIICYILFLYVRGYWHGFTTRKTEPSY